MLRKLIATATLATTLTGVGATTAAHAGTVLRENFRTGQVLVAEPGADCIRNGTQSHVTVKAPIVYADPSFSRQPVAWRGVVYRWNGSTWAAWKTGALQRATATPRTAATFAGPQRFYGASGYYLATVEVFYYHPTTGAPMGDEWHRIDTQRIYTVSAIGALQYQGTNWYCTL